MHRRKRRGEERGREDFKDVIKERGGGRLGKRGEKKKSEETEDDEEEEKKRGEGRRGRGKDSY